MLVFGPITLADVDRWKTLRLRALLDSPSAFGSTHAQVSQWSDAEWLRRVDLLGGATQAGYLAHDGTADVGMAAGVLCEDDPTRAALISMWVAPAHRGRSVGRLLVTRVADWARSRDARTLCLTVTSNNATAVRFYERLGFTMTGRTEPYPNDPVLVELGMARST